MFTGRLSGGAVVTSTPRSSTRPPDGSSKPPIMRRVVVLPQPDGPSSEKNSPARISRSIPSTARTSPNRLVSPTRRISGTADPLMTADVGPRHRTMGAVSREAERPVHVTRPTLGGSAGGDLPEEGHPPEDVIECDQVDAGRPTPQPDDPGPAF